MELIAIIVIFVLSITILVGYVKNIMKLFKCSGFNGECIGDLSSLFEDLSQRIEILEDEIDKNNNWIIGQINQTNDQIDVIENKNYALNQSNVKEKVGFWKRLGNIFNGNS